jgi:uncharacterized protein (TIGR02001 family)
MLTSIRGLLAASALAGSMLAAAPALAQDAEAPAAITVTGNVALTTDYRFRGVSLSGGDAAVQGGITVGHESGLYVGTWSSSIRGGPVYGEQELDLFAGWAGELAPGVKLDAGLYYYVYPGGKVGDANYFEPFASLSAAVGPATAKVGVAYAWEQDSLGGNDNLYVFGRLDAGIPGTPDSVFGQLGYTDGALAPDVLAGGTDDSGLDWQLGASATVYGPLSLSVAYVGVDGASVDGLTDDAVVATLTATF